MRIGVDAFTFAGLRAGVSRYLEEMLAGLMHASSQDEFVLYSPIPIALPSLPRTCEVRIPRGWRKVVPGFWSVDTLPHLVSADRIDVFWGQNATLPLRLRRPCRRVLTVHDTTTILYPGTMDSWNRISSRVKLRAAVRAADLILVDSLVTGRLLRRMLQVPASRLRVVYPGLPSALQRLPASTARATVSARFGLTGDFILTVGTIEPRKDHFTLFHALEMSRDIPVLAVAGAPGWRCQSIVDSMKRAEAQGRVKYLGRVSDPELAALYGAAKAMVYPSVYEGFGLPVLEAMACGCPVLCSWSSSLPEVGGAAACYFRPSDASYLARTLVDLLHDEHRMAAMEALGIEQAAKFSFRMATDRLLDALHGHREAASSVFR